jgi:hypothetical protein
MANDIASSHWQRILGTREEHPGRRGREDVASSIAVRDRDSRGPNIALVRLKEGSSFMFVRIDEGRSDVAAVGTRIHCELAMSSVDRERLGL